MHPISILLLGLAMSTDAFAAAVGKGAAMRAPRWRDALRTGFVFGLIESATPVLGWLLGSSASSLAEAWDHWIAFGLLAGLGLHMIRKALRGDGPDSPARGPGLAALALAGLATSIDALAVGVGLAFMDVDILVVAPVIGLCTFVMVTAGVMAGRALGQALGRRAEIAGGIILIMVGTTILYEHMLA
jgi:putative Mn2+ efflux pump MntP